MLTEAGFPYYPELHPNFSGTLYTFKQNLNRLEHPKIYMGPQKTQPGRMSPFYRHQFIGAYSHKKYESLNILVISVHSFI